MLDTIKKNLLQIQEEIAPYKPKIIAVTKYFDENAIIAAYDAGLRDFGESRVIEAIEKINNLPAEIRNNSKFHFIGHLQTNKVKKVIGTFDYIHSVDSFKLAKEISDEAAKIGKIQQIFLQLNNANEEQKFGFSKSELFEIFTSIKELPAVEIAGLMNMAPLGAFEDELNKLFSEVREIKNELEQTFNCELKEISMGMSQDYKIAAKNGATMLRIGRKLFK
ncbi:pyridoxal phosphate enzyme YggS family [Clostridium sp. CAG:967]|nr:pyridoxal phosphate enzyme YggS family [Clostridium sp. CAG:967]